MLTLARDARGLTQADLVSKLSLGQGTLSKYETGITEPPKEFVDDLSSVLRVTAILLFPDGEAVWLSPLPLSKAEKVICEGSRPHRCRNEYSADACCQDAALF